jgi:hypothetical protein
MRTSHLLRTNSTHFVGSVTEMETFPETLRERFRAHAGLDQQSSSPSIVAGKNRQVAYDDLLEAFEQLNTYFNGTAPSSVIPAGPDARVVPAAVAYAVSEITTMLRKRRRGPRFSHRDRMERRACRGHRRHPGARQARTKRSDLSASALGAMDDKRDVRVVAFLGRNVLAIRDKNMRNPCKTQCLFREAGEAEPKLDEHAEGGALPSLAE